MELTDDIKILLDRINSLESDIKNLGEKYKRLDAIKNNMPEVRIIHARNFDRINAIGKYLHEND
jgi:hypothetical protein